MEIQRDLKRKQLTEVLIPSSPALQSFIGHDQSPKTSPVVFFRHQASSAAAPAVPRIRSMPPARSDADWTSGLHRAAPGANDLEAVAGATN